MSIPLVASGVGSSLLTLAVGLAAVIGLAWLVERRLARPLRCRSLWRCLVASASVWLVAEVVGGNLLLARWLQDFRFSAAIEEASAGRDADLLLVMENVTEPVPSAYDTQEPHSAAIDFQWVPQLVLPGTDAQAPSSQLDVNHADPAGAKVPPDAFVLGWLVGSVILGTWFAGRRVVVMWFTRRYTTPADSRTVEQVRAVAGELAGRCPFGRPGTASLLGRGCRVVESGRLSAPVVYGVLRPTLAVPANFADSLPRPQREAVLAHELVHVAGRDPLWQTAFDLFAALAWWHPGAWLARARHKRACEAAADEGAAALPGGTRALAGALVRLGRQLTALPNFGWAALDRHGRRRSRLGRRVQRLLRNEPAPPQAGFGRRRSVLSTMTAGILVTSMLFGTALARSGASGSLPQNGDDSMTFWQTFWRNSLAGAALAALLGTTSAAAAEDTADAGEVEIVSEVELVDDAHAGEIERLEEEEEEIELLAELDAEVELDLVNGEDEAALIKQVRQAAVEAKRRHEAAVEELARLHKMLTPKLLRVKAQQQSEESRQSVKELTAQLRNRLADATARVTRDDAISDSQRRAHHLRQAAGNLKAVGKHDLADELLREAKAIAQSEPLGVKVQLVQRDEVGRVKLAQPSPKVEVQFKRGPRQDPAAPQVDQLRREMNELKSQVNDMRVMLQRVVERLERDRGAKPAK